MFFRKKEQKPDPTSRIGSFAFFIAIPAYFIVGCLSLLSLIVLANFYPLDSLTWIAFFMSIVACYLLFRHSQLERLRIFIHEFRHTLMVLFSGGKLKDFTVGEHDGNVVYEINEEKKHLVPMITLAPYTFPLLSLPMLIICLFLDGEYHAILAAALGFCLMLDLMTGMGEFRPEQTDLTRVYGKLLISALYIGGSWFCWSSLCLLWVLGGDKAYLDAIFFSIQAAWRVFHDLKFTFTA